MEGQTAVEATAPAFPALPPVVVPAPTATPGPERLLLVPLDAPPSPAQRGRTGAGGGGRGAERLRAAGAPRRPRTALSRPAVPTPSYAGPVALLVPVATGVAPPAAAAVLAAAQRALASHPGCGLRDATVLSLSRVVAGDLVRGPSGLLGPALDGRRGVEALDSDQGRLDGDRRFDRVVGPLAWLPAAWRAWGRDGDGDGRADPQDLDDAAAATVAFLCAQGWGPGRPGAAVALQHYFADPALAREVSR